MAFLDGLEFLNDLLDAVGAEADAGPLLRRHDRERVSPGHAR
jgi:hypothetical protein